jgi:ribosomal protein S18 acetylase RimI-like enzyme
MAARMDNQLVGIAGLILNKGERRQHKAIVWGVYVDPAQRRTGIFQELMKGLEENLPPYVEQLLLDVSIENTVAVEAYKKLGFEIFGTEPRARKIGDHYHDEHLMIKFISNPGHLSGANSADIEKLSKPVMTS